MKGTILESRGTMDVLKISGREHRIDKLSATQLMNLLRRNKLIDFKYVDFDEYAREENKDYS